MVLILGGVSKVYTGPCSQVRFDFKLTLDVQAYVTACVVRNLYDCKPVTLFQSGYWRSGTIHILSLYCYITYHAASK
jgi:hypothetical protein